MNDLRLTTFWSTYHIWAKRQSLNRAYWKSIPECCKPQNKHKKSESLGKKRKRRNKKSTFEDCKNPFHYLLVKNNLQPIKGTCNCSVQLRRRSRKDLDLPNSSLSLHLSSPRLDLNNRSKHPPDNKNVVRDTSGLDHKHIPENSSRMQPVPSLRLNAKTSGDIAREQQDGKKRYKQSFLSDFFGKS